MAEQLHGKWPIVHLFAQAAWHSPAQIRGNRAGLEALGNAVAQALATGASTGKAFVNDGEGYTIDIAVVDDREAASLPLPYLSEEAKGAA